MEVLHPFDVKEPKLGLLQVISDLQLFLQQLVPLLPDEIPLVEVKDILLPLLFILLLLPLPDFFNLLEPPLALVSSEP